MRSRPAMGVPIGWSRRTPPRPPSPLIQSLVHPSWIARLQAQYLNRVGADNRAPLMATSWAPMMGVSHGQKNSCQRIFKPQSTLWARSVARRIDVWHWRKIQPPDSKWCCPRAVLRPQADQAARTISIQTSMHERPIRAIREQCYTVIGQTGTGHSRMKARRSEFAPNIDIDRARSSHVGVGHAVRCRSTRPDQGKIFGGP
jgi:hypothetical protein